LVASYPARQQHMRKVVFLPGAGGSARFWEPVARRLPSDWDKVTRLAGPRG
jgi:surfactin synthase thioesterase subunit